MREGFIQHGYIELAHGYVKKRLHGSISTRAQNALQNAVFTWNKQHLFLRGVDKGCISYHIIY